MVEAVIALGSNVGGRERNLRLAIEMVGRQMRLVGMSSVYETEPMYYRSQGWFLNCVAVVETDLEPLPMLEHLQSIERRMGRRPTKRYGPRVIDLDILFYADRVVSERGLEIPHPKVAERPFVLIPLNEIRPGLVHPLMRRSVSELLASLKSDEQVVRRPGLLAGLSSSSPPRRP